MSLIINGNIVKMHAQLGLHPYIGRTTALDIPGYDGYKGLLYFDALATWYIAGTASR